MDLAGADVEVDALERPHARVLLDQAADLEDRRVIRRTISGRRWRVRDPQPLLDLLRRAAPDGVLVLDREHAVEAALVERVDVARGSRPGRGRGCGSATSPCPTGRSRASDSAPEEAIAVALLGEGLGVLGVRVGDAVDVGLERRDGSMPSHSRCDGSKLRYKPSENIHSHSSGE